MDCRPGCGVCCVAISISSPIPGMPNGKPAGVPCPHLKLGRCAIFGSPLRPKVCSSFPAMPDVCGTSAREAFILITRMERATRSVGVPPAP